jgi:hypothetical protein
LWFIYQGDSVLEAQKKFQTLFSNLPHRAKYNRPSLFECNFHLLDQYRLWLHNYQSITGWNVAKQMAESAERSVQAMRARMAEQETKDREFWQCQGET